MNKRNEEALFHIQDNDCPMYVAAPDYVEALRRWELRMRAENEFAEGEAVPPPYGITRVCEASEFLPAPWEPPSDAEVEGCTLEGLRKALFDRNNDVDRIAKERDQLRDTVRKCVLAMWPNTGDTLMSEVVEQLPGAVAALRADNEKRRLAINELIGSVEALAELYPDPDGLPEAEDGAPEEAWEVVADAIEKAKSAGGAS